MASMQLSDIVTAHAAVDEEGFMVVATPGFRVPAVRTCGAQSSSSSVQQPGPHTTSRAGVHV